MIPVLPVPTKALDTSCQAPVVMGFFGTALVLFAYPVMFGWIALSEVPRWWGRYSTFLLLFNLGGLSLLIAAIPAWRRAWLLPVMVFAAPASVLPFASNSLADLPAMGIVMWGVRLFVSAGLVAEAFDAFRRGGRAPFALAVGVALFLGVVADAGLHLLSRLRDVPLEKDGSYRYACDFNRITEQDITLIGDSFVWGAGVPDGQEFGALMDASGKFSGKVYNLGQKGAGTPQYLRNIAQLSPEHRCRRVIVCYYHNDMPAPERLAHRMQSLGRSVGRGVPSIRFLGDMAAKSLTPTPEAYLQQLVADNAINGTRHLERRMQLREQLEKCYEFARDRSVENPSLLIFPCLMDFDHYPLAATHQDVGDMASKIGFEVLDSLPSFQGSAIPAKNLWVAPNDPHMNANGHAIVAKFLTGRLQNQSRSKK